MHTRNNSTNSPQPHNRKHDAVEKDLGKTPRKSGVEGPRDAGETPARSPGEGLSAGRMLGVNRTTLYNKSRSYQIES